ncbi:MAG: Clp protease N-terminal domain-containing protein, partial [Acidimicrobiales bacterium]
TEVIVSIIGQGPPHDVGSPSFTPRVNRVLELSLRESLQLGETQIGSEHVLLAILTEGQGVGATVLIKHFGVNAEVLRRRLLQQRSDESYVAPPAAGLRDRLQTDIQTVIDRNAFLESEVDRLRSILEANNISPGNGERSA